MESKEIYLTEKMFGLFNKDIQKINTVFENFPQIQEVVIYGSRAKGNYKPYSDIDLTLIGENLSQKLLFNIEIELDNLLLPYIFDINIKEKITNPEFLDHINRVGKAFYKKP